MKKTLLFVLFVGIFQMQGQFWKERIRGNGNVKKSFRKVKEFNQLTVTGSFSVEIVAQETGTIQIVADENLHDIIETFVKNDKLYIRIDKNFQLENYTQLKVIVPVDYLSKISLTGSGHIYSDFIWQWDEIKLKVTGSGKITSRVKMKRITANVTGSGSIILSGKSAKTGLYLTGSGDIDTQALKTDFSEVKITGSGNVYVDVEKELKANILGSGTLYYYGEPEISKIKVLGSGGAIQK